MVHALAESWRVLKVGGRLIDLRPYSSGWPLEIVHRDTEMLAGPLDDKMGVSVDVASDNAVLEAVQRGWFEKEHEGSFEYAWEYQWDEVHNDGKRPYQWMVPVTLPPAQACYQWHNIHPGSSDLDPGS